MAVVKSKLNSAPLRCDICNHSFKHKSSRRRHRRDKHRLSSNCPFCGYQMKRRYLMISHLKTHGLQGEALARAWNAVIDSSQAHVQQHQVASSAGALNHHHGFSHHVPNTSVSQTQAIHIQANAQTSNIATLPPILASQRNANFEMNLATQAYDAVREPLVSSDHHNTEITQSGFAEPTAPIRSDLYSIHEEGGENYTPEAEHSNEGTDAWGHDS